MTSNRFQRQYPRLDAPEGVRVLDEKGQPIGWLEKVSGGGMQIRLTPGLEQPEFKRGARMTVTILEPNGAREKFLIEIRYRESDTIGVRFAGPGGQ
ncbi:MAG TPA: PilZ domain-containing protein, partial [Terriglobales bacterium]|nr:PilZ domain-containing protein [Terriglobales bacterium]